jgi:hypothetical protein
MLALQALDLHPGVNAAPGGEALDQDGNIAGLPAE